MKRKMIIFLGVIVMAFAGVYLALGYPVVINKFPKEVYNDNDSATVINPLAAIDFRTGDNVAYLFFDKQSLKKLPASISISNGKVIECKDNIILEELKANFLFNKTGGDMATCESKLLIYKNGSLVLNSSFVLTDNIIGMQNSKVGWAEAQNIEKLKSVFIKFKPSRKLIIEL